jgi:hypothetical protein
MTTEQISEIKRISTLNRFESKVANTVLEKEEMSLRQCEILNQISEIEIVFTVDVHNLKAIPSDFFEAQARKQLPSSMR